MPTQDPNTRIALIVATIAAVMMLGLGAVFAIPMASGGSLSFLPSFSSGDESSESSGSETPEAEAEEPAADDESADQEKAELTSDKPDEGAEQGAAVIEIDDGQKQAESQKRETDDSPSRAAPSPQREPDPEPKPPANRPDIHVSGVKFVSSGAERRIVRDISRKLEPRRDALAKCYNEHVGNGESTITVDWILTTDGKPIEFSVFSDNHGVKSCIENAISDLRFEHVNDRHPTTRVELRF